MDNIEQYQKSFSERLRSLRNEKGYKQAYLAEKLGISNTLMSRLENMEAVPKFDVLIHISKIFNVSMDYLVGISDNRYLKGTSTKGKKSKNITYTATQKLASVDELPYKSPYDKLFKI